MLAELQIEIAGHQWRLRGIEGADTGNLYWNTLWPASVALARWLANTDLSHTALLELGAGMGLPGMVAAHCGARVTMNDYDKQALTITRKNLVANELADTEVELLPFDWEHPPSNRHFELIVGSDLGYEPAVLRPLAIAIDTLLTPGGAVVLADPIRSSFTAFLMYLRDLGFEHRQDLVDIEVDGRNHRVGLYTIRRVAQVGHTENPERGTS